MSFIMFFLTVMILYLVKIFNTKCWIQYGDI